MEKEFSKNWKTSTKPRKQRKYFHNAPLHIKQRFLGCHLSKELRKKHGRRTVEVVKGDKVKIMRGNFKGKTGAVEKSDVRYTRIFIQGMMRQKKEGSKVFIPFHPSNLMIIELKEDKNRMKK